VGLRDDCTVLLPLLVDQFTMWGIMGSGMINGVMMGQQQGMGGGDEMMDTDIVGDAAQDGVTTGREYQRVL